MTLQVLDDDRYGTHLPVQDPHTTGPRELPARVRGFRRAAVVGATEADFRGPANTVDPAETVHGQGGHGDEHAAIRQRHRDQCERVRRTRPQQQRDRQGSAVAR